MKYLVFHLVFISFFSILSAQTSNLQGKIMDEKMTEPLPFAQLFLLQQDSVIIATTSDFDGNYQFANVMQGIYNLKVTYKGFPDLVFENIEIQAKPFTIFHIEYPKDGSGRNWIGTSEIRLNTQMLSAAPTNAQSEMLAAEQVRKNTKKTKKRLFSK